MKLSSGIAPLPAMDAAGVSLSLGTDGAASNNSLDMGAETKAMALVHKLAGPMNLLPLFLCVATRWRECLAFCGAINRQWGRPGFLTAHSR
jgi:5-methylthioadenosine/S-adenosylhomocysteine deaminase